MTFSTDNLVLIVGFWYNKAMTATKENFITAFWQLYQDKPIQKISIRELCATAGYNRTTFYDHFRDIYDLLEKAIYQILEAQELSKEVMLDGFFDSPDRLLRNFITLFKRNHHKLQLLIERGQHTILEDIVKERLLDNFQSRITITLETSYILEYHISAIFGVLRHWTLSGENLPEEKLVELIYEIATIGVFAKITQQEKGLGS